MIDSQTQTEKLSGLERHFHSIMNVCILAALGWTANTLMDLKDRSIKTEVSVQSIKEQVIAASSDRWTGSDQRRFELDMDRRLEEIKRRIEITERARGR